MGRVSRGGLGWFESTQRSTGWVHHASAATAHNCLSRLPTTVPNLDLNWPSASSSVRRNMAHSGPTCDTARTSGRGRGVGKGGAAMHVCGSSGMARRGSGRDIQGRSLGRGHHLPPMRMDACGQGGRPKNEAAPCLVKMKGWARSRPGGDLRGKALERGHRLRHPGSIQKLRMICNGMNACEAG